MTPPGTVLDAQVDALERVVESHREARCREILEAARRRAAETLARAHRESRARVRAAIDDERHRMGETLAATRARLASRARERRQRRDRERLERAWPRLEEALAERWRDSEGRRRWVEALAEEALARLRRDRWRIEHPNEWDPAELGGALERVVRHCGGESPAFAGCPDIRAGLRFSAAGAYLDGTVPGLLADASRVEAELLAELGAVDEDEPAP